MDSFELNKIAGAILASVLVLFLIDAIGGALIHPVAPEKSAYVPEGTEMFMAGAAPVAAAKDEGPVSSVGFIATASVEEGQKGFRKCASCHSVEKGGPNGTGPNLYGVVGRALGAVASFNYSAGMAEHGGNWDYDALDAFLRKPKDYIKGTKMSFAGIKKPEDRAEMIAYLRTLADNPIALPEPAAVEEAVEEMVEEAADAAQDAMMDHGADHSGH